MYCTITYSVTILCPAGNDPPKKNFCFTNLERRTFRLGQVNVYYKGLGNHMVRVVASSTIFG